MTMLDRMRRHKNWLKWSLAIVVLAFIFLYIPSFLDEPGAAGLNDVVATVDGRDITVARFRRAYQAQMQQYRQAYGGSVDERMLKQLGIDQRIVQQMVEEETSLAEARRLGISATDQEVRARIAALPGFLENGQFIGEERYIQLLQTQNLRADEFEEQVRRGVTVEKLQAALTNWISVGDKELESEYLRRNEKVKLAVVSFPADKFREGLDATDAEMASYFEAHRNDLRIPEKRKIRFALIDTQGMRDRTQVSAQDVQRSYEDNQQQYSTPEQVRASHILLKTEGKDDATVKKQAEDLLVKIKAGGDFGQLATKFSEDEQSNKKNGDLDFFGKGQMVPEFDTAVFAMQPGQTSEVVKTQYGYHIIRMTERRAATTKTIDEVRPQIEDQLKWERAQAEAQRLADEVGAKLKKPGDFDTFAKGRGLTVSETDFLAREDPIAGLGMAPAVSERMFALKIGDVSEAIRTPQGFAFVTVTGRNDSYVPKIEEVKARVREEVIKQKAVDAARQRAAGIAGQARSGSLEAAAKSAGLEVTTTDLIARGAPVGSLGVSPAVDAIAFSLAPGTVSEAIVTDHGAVVVKVLEKISPPPTEPASAKGTLRTEILNERRQRFFGAYMAKARERMRIDINRELVARLLA